MKTTSCYFVGYAEKSKGFRFYCPTAHTRIAESHNAKFIEDFDLSHEPPKQLYAFEEHDDHYSLSQDSGMDNSVTIPLYLSGGTPLSSNVTALDIPTPSAVATTFPNPDTLVLHDPIHSSAAITEAPESSSQFHAPFLRKSMRTRKSAIPHDYLCYLQEVEYDLGDEDDPVNYKQAIASYKSELWKAAMTEELASMESNHVWTLVNGLESCLDLG
ncbi:uncharacterized protein [Malus domestica]|uniref:uncharacterized protein n=1 Tax=Malus domestica TaxID=3750 RepID=UPI0039754085